MASVTVQGGDTLWSIAQSQGFTSKAEINKYKNSIYELNKGVIGDNANLIKPNQVLALPDKNTVFGSANTPVSDPIAASSQGKTDKPAEQNLGKKFDGWVEGCADSLSGEVDEKGNPTYKSNVNPFNMAKTPEFITAVKAEDYKEANRIYKEKVEALASSLVDNADTDGDGMLSVSEFIKKEKDDTEKKYGKFKPDSEQELAFEHLATRQFAMINLDGPANAKPEDVKDFRIDKKEYAAFLKAVDGNNSQNIANGEITREEYSAMGDILEGEDLKPMAKFMKKERDSYESLYGTYSDK